MDVIEIKGCDSYLIKSHNLKGGRQYLLNGEILNDELLRVDLVIKKTDLFQTLSNQKKIGDYRRGDEIISLETFKSKTQYYDSDSSEEETLRAIANRKELSGFEPHYLEIEPEVIELNVVAYISNTESKFINANIVNSTYKNSVLFDLSGRRVAIDEYMKLKEKFKTHAKFEIPKDSLRFTKINNRYVFLDGYPFGDYDYNKSYLSLEEAQLEELAIRDRVYSVVNNAVFKETISDEKNIMLISELNLIKNMQSIDEVRNSLNYIIHNLTEYAKNIKFK